MKGYGRKLPGLIYNLENLRPNLIHFLRVPSPVRPGPVRLNELVRLTQHALRGNSS